MATDCGLLKHQLCYTENKKIQTLGIFLDKKWYLKWIATHSFFCGTGSLLSKMWAFLYSQLYPLNGPLEHCHRLCSTSTCLLHFSDVWRGAWTSTPLLNLYFMIYTSGLQFICCPIRRIKMWYSLLFSFFGKLSDSSIVLNTFLSSLLYP